MGIKFVAGVTVFAAIMTGAAFAEEAAPPKISKAEVEKILAGIKSDPAKMAVFCEIEKLHAKAEEVAQKDEGKADEAIDKQIEDLYQKLDPDFEKVARSDLEDESVQLLLELASTCK